MSRVWQTVFALCLAVACAVMAYAGAPAPLPKIGTAPEFRLTDQDGRPFSLRALRGRVAVVTFIFTSCSSTCPVLTAKLVNIQRSLGPDTPRVHFVGITVDPLHDSPAVLRRYAKAFSAPRERFSFLTGPIPDIERVVRAYGVFRKAAEGREVDHTFLTSIVDRSGTLRVQYLGWRFDEHEFLGDLRSLVHERAEP
ncbi:MAG: SCO family protein [Burkholderiales bacterium]